MLNRDSIVSSLVELGLERGTSVIVHSSLSSLGYVDGGSSAVVDALLESIGPSGTLVVPAFTPDISGPRWSEQASAVTEDNALEKAPLFHDSRRSSVGAISNEVLGRRGRKRSNHPQASVASIGARAEEIVRRQNLGFALGMDSPFGRLYNMNASILLLGVGHDRNSFLHHAESKCMNKRLKLRRFPYMVQGERVWIETRDVADDNGRFFPKIGSEWSDKGMVKKLLIGSSWCTLLESRPFIDYAVSRLATLLDEPR